MNTELLSPADGKTVSICAPFQQEFHDCKNFGAEKKVIRKLVKQNKPEGYFSTPAPVKLSWKTDEKISAVEISESCDFSESIKLEIVENQAEIFNLKKGTEYFWRINDSKAKRFFTDNIAPRWIFANGCVNIRDVGGEENINGQKLKQNMLFRGPRLENDLNENGLQSLRNLKIRTEIDLRKESDGELDASPLGDDVKYIYHPCNGYEDFLQIDSKASTKALIEYFADETNYPIYFHCRGGADRTGTLALFLGAILGLDDKTLLYDYELTMITSPEKKMSRSRKKKIKKFLKILCGRDKHKSLGENAVDFLRECGVSDKTFDLIRKIMLD